MEMITLAQARDIARQEVARIGAVNGFDAVIVDDRTVTERYGWLFFYESPRYLETGDEDQRLLGNPPVFVDSNGIVHRIGTVDALEDYLRILRIPYRDVLTPHAAT